MKITKQILDIAETEYRKAKTCRSGLKRALCAISDSATDREKIEIKKKFITVRKKQLAAFATYIKRKYRI